MPLRPKNAKLYFCLTVRGYLNIHLERLDSAERLSGNLCKLPKCCTGVFMKRVEQIYVGRPPAGGRRHSMRLQLEHKSPTLTAAEIATYRTKPLSLNSLISCIASQTGRGGIMHTADLWSFWCELPDILLSCLATCWDFTALAWTPKQ